MPSKINVSFHIKEMPMPFNMIAFKMMINHFAGMILLMICKGKGILVIGKIKPDNKITGNINPIKEIIIADCCVFEIVEIKIPKDSAFTMNKTLSKPNKNKLPLTGI